ncbi:MAG TPA: transcriptional repressor [Dehalococcoidales bacterium]|nr:transcriptional repressor [Dehalococcoidales bacterium]
MSINKAFRETRQKQLILHILEGTRSHPTADDIYQQARKHLPHISKGTVYRNLGILQEEGILSELNLNGTVSRYEVKNERHYHFRCEQCGRVTDLKHPVDTGLNNIVEKETGFQVFSHQVEFLGICLECQSKTDNV